MREFKKYDRIEKAELMPVDEGHISDFKKEGKIQFADYFERDHPYTVSISQVDLENGSPKIGDMIARNPKNHNDRWLVAAEYCKNNFSGIKTEGLDFGQATEALNQGKRVARKGWNGKGLFVFKQVPSIIEKDIVPKMQSLPQSVKDEFERRFKEMNLSSIRYDNQLAIVNPNNTINGWAPSVSDALAKDWEIL